MTPSPPDMKATRAVFTPQGVESLIELMRQAQINGTSMMKATMEGDAWVIRPFDPRVIGGNRSDAPANSTNGDRQCSK